MANLSSGPTGTVITYTFTIANTGNAAGDLTLTDALGNGPTAGLLYVSGSGAWSNGQGALTDASDGAERATATAARSTTRPRPRHPSLATWWSN